jgi:hypothetical protein
MTSKSKSIQICNKNLGLPFKQIDGDVIIGKRKTKKENYFLKKKLNWSARVIFVKFNRKKIFPLFQTFGAPCIILLEQQLLVVLMVTFLRPCWLICHITGSHANLIDRRKLGYVWCERSNGLLKNEFLTR